jgi:hypothetical protein
MVDELPEDGTFSSQLSTIETKYLRKLRKRKGLF